VAFVIFVFAFSTRGSVMRRTFLFFVILGLAVASAHSTAQHQLVPVSQLKGAPALELALRKLDTVGNFMMTTAHPDDENNAMLAYFAHGKGFRTSLVTATHGEGGQNEIGPELFEALAVLRTEELAAAPASTPISTSRAPSTLVTRSASKRRSRSGATRKSWATSSA